MLEVFGVCMKALGNRERSIRVYLPKGYEAGRKKYPVVYMHDGQNVFEDEGAFGGVSLNLKKYLDDSGTEVIVVTIDRHPDFDGRVNETCPWVNGDNTIKLLGEPSELGGEGDAYLSFIVDELKPLIDQKYRTDANQSAMAGISLGGLITVYAACKYPQIFSRIAAFSSGFYRNQREIEEFIKGSDLSPIEYAYMDWGTKEGGNPETWQGFIDSNQAVAEILKKKVRNFTYEVVQEGEHHYFLFKNRVPGVIASIFGESRDEN
ncbi:alpha/beta hydrolase [Falsibacillus pallidus]|uniref:Putative alpha/beta superfamily hydrolase n=1 Tax=Falsibacillus pallidus TaxID=493781 RepID=A0A370GT36_9BACI|nr:alpha/beta hydrolase-fold protein [Falsibacillus pallidus]RDI45684.1 putative alpha/beta superfamily hydrolase [Falsibacillus pallidus]